MSASLSPPKCLACGSTHLSPATTLKASNNSVQTGHVADQGWLGTVFNVNFRAHVCAGCGYLMLFADPEGLESLRKHWTKLEPSA